MPRNPMYQEETDRCVRLSCQALALGGCVGIGAIAVLLFSPDIATAQQSSLRQQVIGAWDIVSVEITSPDDTHVEPFGPNPHGIIMFDADGRYVNAFGKPDRPKPKAESRLAITPEEFGIAAKQFAANFGTWSVADTNRTITLQFEGALHPSDEGASATYALDLDGDDMTLSIALPGGRDEVVEYRRAR